MLRGQIPNGIEFTNQALTVNQLLRNVLVLNFQNPSNPNNSNVFPRVQANLLNSNSIPNNNDDIMSGLFQYSELFDEGSNQVCNEPWNMILLETDSTPRFITEKMYLIKNCGTFIFGEYSTDLTKLALVSDWLDFSEKLQENINSDVQFSRFEQFFRNIEVSN